MRASLAPVSMNDLNSRSRVSAVNSFAPPDGKTVRKTLEPMKPASRISHIPILTDGRKSSLTGRKSSLSGRKSSIAGRPSDFRQSSVQNGRGGKSDPRPTSNPDYRMACIHNIIEYLAMNGFDRELSPKVLSSPSSKDFIYILTFLLKKLIPNFEFAAKPEDEIPSLCKQIGYPFAISKSTLAAAGTPHTWPSLLVFLQWIVELLVYRDHLDTVDVTFDDFDASQTIKFDAVVHHYTNFMAGRDTLDADLARDFAKANNQIVSETELMIAQVGALRAELEHLTAAQPPLPKAKSDRDGLLAEREKFIQLLENLKVQKNKSIASLKDLDEQLATKEIQLKECENHVFELRARVGTQSVSVEDVQRMERERGQAEELLSDLSRQCKDLQATNWTSESDLTQRSSEVDRTLTNLAEQIRNIRPSQSLKDSKGAVGTTGLCMEFISATTPSAILTHDVSTVLQPSLMQLKRLVTQQCQRAEDGAFTARDETDKLEEQVQTLKEERNQLERSLKKLESTMRLEKQRMEMVEEQLTQELRGKEAEVEALRQSNMQNFGQQDDCNALNNELASLKSRNQEEEECVRACVRELEDTLSRHQECVVLALQKTNQACGDTAQALSRLNVPFK